MKKYFKILFSINLAVLLFCLVNCCAVFAEINFQYQSNSHFKNDVSILPGVLEGYVLENEPDVKLLIGYFTDKNFYSEAANTTENELKNGLFERASSLDPINSQTDRKLIGFKRLNIDGKIIIQMKYTLTKHKQAWNEATTYIFSNGSSAMASVQFPHSLTTENKIELLKGIDDVQINYTTPKTVLRSFKEGFFKFISAYQTPKIFKQFSTMGPFVVGNSYAGNAAYNESHCGLKNLEKTDMKSVSNGSGVSNLSKIANAIKDETEKLSELTQTKLSIDDSKMECLTSLYKDTQDKAKQYLNNLAEDANCFRDDNKFLTNRDLTELQKTDKARYRACLDIKIASNTIDHNATDLKKLLSGETSAYLECAQNHANGEPEIDNIQGVMNHAQKAFCCMASNPNNKDDSGGPLFHILEMEYIKEHNIKGPLSNDQVDALAKECRDNKYSEKDKDGQSFLSESGFADCVENFIDGAKDLITSAINSVTSLFDWETIKALGQLVMDFPESAFNIVKMIGQEIAAKTYSATSCMSPYDAKKYVCKLVPEVASVLLGPVVIKRFAEALVSKASQTALGQVIAQAVNESTQIQKIKAAGAAVSKATGKVTKAAGNSRYIKPSVSVLKKVKKLLGTDISTPAKDWLLGKGKKVSGARKKIAAAAAPAAADAKKVSNTLANTDPEKRLIFKNSKSEMSASSKARTPVMGKSKYIVDEDHRKLAAEAYSYLRESIKNAPDSMKKAAQKENLAHTRRLMKNLTNPENIAEMKKLGIDTDALLTGVVAHDIGKGGAAVYQSAARTAADAKNLTADDFFRGFLLHEEFAIETITKRGTELGMSEQQIKRMVDTIENHNGPGTKGTWWQINYEAKVGKTYEIPQSKEGYVAAFLDRGDQGSLNLVISESGEKTLIGGPRKILVDTLGGAEPMPFADAVKNALETNPNGTLLQLDDLVRLNPDKALNSTAIVKDQFNSVKETQSYMQRIQMNEDKSFVLVDGKKVDNPNELFKALANPTPDSAKLYQAASSKIEKK